MVHCTDTTSCSGPTPPKQQCLNGTSVPGNSACPVKCSNTASLEAFHRDMDETFSRLEQSMDRLAAFLLKRMDETAEVFRTLADFAYLRSAFREEDPRFDELMKKLEYLNREEADTALKEYYNFRMVSLKKFLDKHLCRLQGPSFRSLVMLPNSRHGQIKKFSMSYKSISMQFR